MLATPITGETSTCLCGRPKLRGKTTVHQDKLSTWTHAMYADLVDQYAVGVCQLHGGLVLVHPRSVLLTALPAPSGSGTTLRAISPLCCIRRSSLQLPPDVLCIHEGDDAVQPQHTFQSIVKPENTSYWTLPRTPSQTYDRVNRTKMTSRKEAKRAPLSCVGQNALVRLRSIHI